MFIDIFTTIAEAATGVTDILPTINWVVPISLGSSATFVTILGFFIKRWINGTMNDIKELQENKVDNKICTLREVTNGKIFQVICEDLKEVKNDQKEIKKTIADLGNLITNLRINTNWDGRERRSK